MPQPVQKPHPPVWFGEAHPAILAATAKYGRGWNTVPVPLAEMKQRLRLLEDACSTIGRNFAEIEISLETQIMVAKDRDGLRQQVAKILSLTADGDPPDPAILAFVNGESESLPTALTDPFIIGTVDEVEQKLRAYMDLGVSHFMFWFMDAPEEAGLRLFAEKVMPRFR